MGRLSRGGIVRYALKTPYRDGTTHVIFEPEDFIARLVALVPKPRAHLTRYHGVFAPASPDRARIVPGAHAANANERGDAAATARERAGVGLRRDALVFPGEKGRFTRLNHEGSSRRRRMAATIQVRITESGDERAAAVGSLQKFNGPEDTPIKYTIDSSIYAWNRRGNADLSDISEGDLVLLKFEDTQGVRQATNLRNEQTKNTEVRERIRQEGRIVRNSIENMNSNNTVAAVSTNERSSLPASASPMPLLALIGMLFAGLATVVRRVRQ